MSLTSTQSCCGQPMRPAPSQLFSSGQLLTSYTQAPTKSRSDTPCSPFRTRSRDNLSPVGRWLRFPDGVPARKRAFMRGPSGRGRGRTPGSGGASRLGSRARREETGCRGRNGRTRACVVALRGYGGLAVQRTTAWPRGPRIPAEFAQTNAASSPGSHPAATASLTAGASLVCWSAVNSQPGPSASKNSPASTAWPAVQSSRRLTILSSAA